MSVYVDSMRAKFGVMVMCHMIADSTPELLAMADHIGVKRCWIQKPGTPGEHFDICINKRKKAIAAGAVQITQRELGQKILERRQRNSPPPPLPPPTICPLEVVPRRLRRLQTPSLRGPIFGFPAYVVEKTMSKNCIKCVENERTGPDLLCDKCRASSPVRYVLGFMFSEDLRRVALIRKRKPEWQAGLLNGIGGKIEGDETESAAMVREFQEEAGLLTREKDWVKFAELLEPSSFNVACFACVGELRQILSLTDELIEIRSILEAIWNGGTVENIGWLIQLAIDHLADGRPHFARVAYAAS